MCGVYFHTYLEVLECIYLYMVSYIPKRHTLDLFPLTPNQSKRQQQHQQQSVKHKQVPLWENFIKANNPCWFAIVVAFFFVCRLFFIFYRESKHYLLYLLRLSNRIIEKKRQVYNQDERKRGELQTNEIGRMGEDSPRFRNSGSRANNKRSNDFSRKAGSRTKSSSSSSKPWNRNTTNNSGSNNGKKPNDDGGEQIVMIWSLLRNVAIKATSKVVLQTAFGVVVTLYVLNQNHLLPRPISSIVSRTLFWPTMPITASRRIGKWVTRIDETVVMGGAPFGFLNYPEKLYQEYNVSHIFYSSFFSLFFTERNEKGGKSSPFACTKQNTEYYFSNNNGFDMDDDAFWFFHLVCLFCFVFCFLFFETKKKGKRSNQFL